MEYVRKRTTAFAGDIRGRLRPENGLQKYRINFKMELVEKL